MPANKFANNEYLYKKKNILIEFKWNEYLQEHFWNATLIL